MQQNFFFIKIIYINIFSRGIIFKITITYDDKNFGFQ